MDRRGLQDLQDQWVQRDPKDSSGQRVSQALVSEERRAPPVRRETKETEATSDCLGLMG